MNNYIIILNNKKTFQDEILSEWLGNPGKGTLGGKNPKNLLREPAPGPGLKFVPLALIWENQLVFILDLLLLQSALSSSLLLSTHT